MERRPWLRFSPLGIKKKGEEIGVKYVRIDKNSMIVFLDDNLHEILETDTKISDRQYKELLLMQEAGAILHEDVLKLMF